MMGRALSPAARYEQDVATIFNDLTVKTGASFAMPFLAIVSFLMVSIFACAAVPVTATSCPRCLLKSTAVLIRSILAAAIVFLAMVSLFTASLSMWSSTTCVSTNVPAAVAAATQPVYVASFAAIWSSSLSPLIVVPDWHLQKLNFAANELAGVLGQLWKTFRQKSETHERVEAPAVELLDEAPRADGAGRRYQDL